MSGCARTAPERLTFGLLTVGLLIGATACEQENDPQISHEPVVPVEAGFEPLPMLDASSFPLPVSPLCEGGSASAAQSSIDDLSDGDGFIQRIDERNGRWVISNDGTGEQLPQSIVQPEPVQLDAGESYAVHTLGHGFTGWGAAVGFAFQTKDGALCQYNAMRYQGIAFQARGAGELRVEMSVPDTLPSASGGMCTGEGCDNRHGFQIELSGDWRNHQLGFDQLAQEPGWGQPALFGADRILELRFRAPAQAEFEIWLDNVRFFPDLAAQDAGIDESLDTAVQDGG